VIDPITRDLIDSADGWFVESNDSRTAVLFQLESTYGAWWGDPTSGSKVRAIKSGEEPGTARTLRTRCFARCSRWSRTGSSPSSRCAPTSTRRSASVVLITYRDRASGRPVDLAYVPFGG
jgi:hypothetical protein